MKHDPTSWTVRQEREIDEILSSVWKPTLGGACTVEKAESGGRRTYDVKETERELLAKGVPYVVVNPQLLEQSHPYQKRDLGRDPAAHAWHRNRDVDVHVYLWSEEAQRRGKTFVLHMDDEKRRDGGIRAIVSGRVRRAQKRSGVPTLDMLTTRRRQPRNRNADHDQRRPVAVTARDGYRIGLRYSDGVEGEVDLSGLAGCGVFKAWLEPEFFKQVYISEWRSIAWSDDIEICADALYLEITGKSPEDIWPGLRRESDPAEVSRFYGIIVRIADGEDGEPRLRARYGDSEATVGIRDLTLVEGELPRRARGLLLEWAAEHRDELLKAWERAQRGEAPGRIAPLD